MVKYSTTLVGNGLKSVRGAARKGAKSLSSPPKNLPGTRKVLPIPRKTDHLRRIGRTGIAEVPVCRTGIVEVPYDREGVAGAVGFPDEDGAVVHGEAEAGEVGCEAFVLVCAEGSGSV